MIDKIKETFFKFINKSISLEEIEIFLFANLQEIEKIFTKEDYFYLIDFDFKDKNSFARMETLINKYISISEFEKYRLNTILNNLININENNIDSLLKIYDEYGKGYCFLDILAIDYGLDLSRALYELYIDRLLINDKINKLHSNIKIEAEKIIRFLDQNKIVITEKYKYLDYRLEEDKADQKRKIPQFFTNK
jgi:hypothetical protein